MTSRITVIGFDLHCITLLCLISGAAVVCFVMSWVALV